MFIYLMRHGAALSLGGPIQEDRLRPLSPQGREQVRRVAEALRERICPLQSILSSPLERAQETARLLAEVCGVPQVETSTALAPNASPAGLRRLLATYEGLQSLLLVGHHPDVTLWTAYLSGLEASACPKFSPGSVAALELNLANKDGTFLWFQSSENLS